MSRFIIMSYQSTEEPVTWVLLLDNELLKEEPMRDTDGWQLKV
jgi:hypothetical protein